MHPTPWSAAAVVLVLLLAAAPGCSQSENEQHADPNEDANRAARVENAPAQAATAPGLQPQGQVHTESVATTPTYLPAPQGEPDARTVDEAYPGLASAALIHARLADLGQDVLLQAGDVVIMRQEIEAGIVHAPAQLREQLGKNALFLLEQLATQRLLVQQAGQAGLAGGGSEQALLQAYVQTLVQDAQVSDQEVAAFYADNRHLVGQATLEQVKEQIRQHLLQDRQQQVLDEHLRTLALRVPVAVSADWVRAQAERALDNPVDQARTSERPTLASFGADTCIPCQMMVPTRDAISTKYQGRANVVYVHVGEEQILASRYGVTGIPLLVFFDAQGREVHRHTGMMSQEQIEEQFRLMGVRD